jgi:hypothetical protein
VNGVATTERVVDSGDRSRSAVIAELVTVKTGYIKVVLPTGAAAQPDLAQVLTGKVRWRPTMWVL